MKKLLIVSFLINPQLYAAIDLQDMKDVGYIAGAATISAIITTVASCYWHPAAAERARIEAEQEDKRNKFAQDKAVQEKQEKDMQEKAKAHIALHQLIHSYNLETHALLHKDLAKNRDQFQAIINNKQSSPLTCFQEYRSTLKSDIEKLSKLSILLSPEEKVLQVTLLTQLHKVMHAFNTIFTKDIYDEEVKLKRLERLEQAEQRKIKREEVEIKKLHGEVEAQQNTKEIKESVALLRKEVDIIRAEVGAIKKNNDLEFSSIHKLINALSETFKETMNAKFAQIAALFVQRFDNAKKEFFASQSQAQPASSVLVHQVQPPYNPAAVAAMHQSVPSAPSEAIDTDSINPIPAAK